ncbi:hypothetical protein N869_13290 [Cellulomonas bogoriensis 69B4 = DSM 16987]|uniref:Uncharacterized protein n=1 Tax=Cellulomonas bogoriensis 69B4 = DSM 16987 TaxID=1386082 RepID=A0A0A0C2C9_9CELL|nr:hypothetical protein N869_13290 [Cellulomonas bogoriensis 69B4 = DSM 16987]
MRVLYSSDPAVAEGLGMVGSQFTGWERVVPAGELSDPQVEEVESSWSDTGRVPPLGVRAVYRGHEYGARWDQGSGVVTLHLGMGDPVPAAGETLGRRGRDGRVVRVPVRFVSRVFTRSASAVWRGDEVQMDVLDRRRVRVRMREESLNVERYGMVRDSQGWFTADVNFLSIEKYCVHERDLGP